VKVLGDSRQVALGTIVDSDGWIVTKASELKGKTTCKLKDGREFDARLVGFHDKHDLAMLKIDAKDLSAVEWRDGKSALVGNLVASAGTGEMPVGVGIISVAVRELPKGRRGPRNPTAGGYLGIALDPDAAGAKVNQVMTKSAAEKAGLKANDIILKVSGQAIEDMEALLETLQGHKPGDVVQLQVKRGDKEIELEAKLDKRPTGRSDFQNSLGSELSDRRLGFSTILQHDSVLRARDCGGPLVDLDGKVIGVNIARAGRTETYAVPAEAIKPILADLKSGKLPPPKSMVLAEKLAPLKVAVQKAEADRAAAEKKVKEVKSALEKAEAEKAAAEKVLAEAKAVLEKAEKEEKKEQK
jgi:serine protease Do